MTRYKGMSRKMVPSTADLVEFDHLHSRMLTLHATLNPEAWATPSLMAASGTFTLAREAMLEKTEWVARLAEPLKSSLQLGDLEEIEAIWRGLQRLAATLHYHSGARHPLYVVMQTVKASWAECSGEAQSWSFPATEVGRPSRTRRGCKPP